MKVTNNQEKANAYKTQMARFKLARDQGFYYEAIFILYAMMEDRLSSFLLHAGVSNNNCNELSRNIEVRQSLESIINVAADKQIKLLKISIKAEIIQKLLTWAASQALENSSDTYATALARQINQTAGKDEILIILDKIQGWCKARNELVHALMNKNLENQEQELHSLVDDGYAHCRKLDNFVRSFKIRNNIHERFNIQ